MSGIDNRGMVYEVYDVRAKNNPEIVPIIVGLHEPLCIIGDSDLNKNLKQGTRL